MVNAVAFLFLLTSLIVNVSYGEDCGDYDKIVENLCYPVGPPRCKEPTDPVMGCADGIIMKAAACSKDIDSTKAKAEAIKMIIKATCESASIQKVFEDEDCWKPVPQCAVDALEEPVRTKTKDPKSKICMSAVSKLHDCWMKIPSDACVRRQELNGTLFKDLIDQSKCLTGSASAIKIAVQLFLFTIVTLLIAL